ncbi:MAG TPA: IS110 family transposase [Longimicrobiaceae bacterium]|nr:IS110 family transposase [Longimicrobiaceae bacterium]
MAETASQGPAGVIGGFDCHSTLHVAVALDLLGRRLGATEFPATAAGYQQAAAWLQGLGPVVAVGVESTGSYGAALARHLSAQGLRVIEINQPHRHTRARRGKSDAIDAEAAARKVLSGEATGDAKDTLGIVAVIRQLSVARDGAVKARAAALCQLRDLLITAPAAVREQLARRRSLEGKAAVCARFRLTQENAANPAVAAKQALRSVARRIAHLTAEAAEPEAQLDDLVEQAAPQTREKLGLGTQNTAALLIAAGQNIQRLRSEAAFAHLCAAAPIPASSGKTIRHRLNPNGNRQANRALHMAVVVRLRYCARTRAYLQRRMEQGKTKREAIRCLKRYVAREVYRTLRADLGIKPSPQVPANAP